MSSTIDLADLESKVGSTRVTDFGQITRREIRRYARSVEDENPLYFDVEYAREHGYDDLVAPPTFLPAIFEPGAGPPAAQLREDGLDTSVGLDLPDDVLQMGGGKDLTFHRYATAGDRVIRETTLHDIYQKESSSFGTLTFIEQLEEYASEEGDIFIENQMTRIIGERE